MRILFALLALATVSSWSLGRSLWYAQGHRILTVSAVRALPHELPRFFRASASVIGELAQEPDIAKNRGATFLRAQESPEHFINCEKLGSRPLPADRYRFIALCAELGLDPSSVGLAPYAVMEWTERLMVAFAEHRKWPGDESVQLKCKVYAGFLAHYAQDLCMPLHVTIHHDGRAGADGGSPHTGIHALIDSLITRCRLSSEELAADQDIHALADPFASIVSQIERSRRLVDATYALEKELTPMAAKDATGESTRESEAVRAFALERGREAVRFTASLYFSAWERSAAIELPDWLNHAGVGGQ